jgi:hypothetical protein
MVGWLMKRELESIRKELIVSRHFFGDLKQVMKILSEDSRESSQDPNRLFP